MFCKKFSYKHHYYNQRWGATPDWLAYHQTALPGAPHRFSLHFRHTGRCLLYTSGIREIARTQKVPMRRIKELLAEVHDVLLDICYG